MGNSSTLKVKWDMFGVLHTDPEGTITALSESEILCLIHEKKTLNTSEWQKITIYSFCLWFWNIHRNKHNSSIENAKFEVMRLT